MYFGYQDKNDFLKKFVYVYVICQFGFVLKIGILKNIIIFVNFDIGFY